MLLIILINPYYIFNFSVIFSYFSVISIMCFYDRINSFFYMLIMKLFKIRYQKSNFKKYVLKLLFLFTKNFCLTLCVTIGTLPLQIYLYNCFNIITFISNLIIYPLILVIRVISVISMFCIYFFNISDILFNACFIPLRIIIKLSKFLNIDITKISIATPSVISIIMYYTNIIMFIIDEKIIKKFILNKKHIRKTIKNIISAISVVFILFIVFEQIYINYFEEYIIYFNVKQGNMALIRKDRKTIIVDLGSTTEQLASQVLNKYLKAKNIKKIDNIFISHFHTDHMNGIYDISSDIKIESVTYGKIWHKINEEYENFVLFAKDNNINLSEVSENDEIKLSKNIFVKCICPRKDEKINSSDEINSNSAVYLFNVNSKENNKFLFMGDATKETEKYILSKNTDDLENIFILQIGHHGSKTSTSDELIRKTSPKISFISAYKKVYNHPSDETLEILNKYKIKCHVTEIDKVLKFKL